MLTLFLFLTFHFSNRSDIDLIELSFRISVKLVRVRDIYALIINIRNKDFFSKINKCLMLHSNSLIFYNKNKNLNSLFIIFLFISFQWLRIISAKKKVLNLSLFFHISIKKKASKQIISKKKSRTKVWLLNTS